MHAFKKLLRIGSVGGALVFCCCFMTYCATLCCRSGGGEEEIVEGVTPRKYKMKRETIIKKTPATPIIVTPIVTPVVKKTFFAKLVPKFNILKPLIAKIRAPQQIPTLIRQPLVQTTTATIATPIASPSKIFLNQTQAQPLATTFQATIAQVSVFAYDLNIFYSKLRVITCIYVYILGKNFPAIVNYVWFESAFTLSES